MAAAGEAGRSDLELLKVALLNEKGAPEVLEFQTELVERLHERMLQGEAAVKELDEQKVSQWPLRGGGGVHDSLRRQPDPRRGEYHRFLVALWESEDVMRIDTSITINDVSIDLTSVPRARFPDEGMKSSAISTSAPQHPSVPL